MSQEILNEDWSIYDNRKIRDRRDRSKFSCEEKWEVYLVEKILRQYPYKSEQAIRTAIAESCKAVPAPRPREIFVKTVISKL